MRSAFVWLALIGISASWLFALSIFEASEPLAAGFVVAVAGVTLVAASRGRRGPRGARAALVVVSVLAAQALTVPLWYWIGSRAHGLEGLVPGFARIASLLGYPMFVGDGAMHLDTGSHLVPVTVTWEKLGLMPASWIVLAGIVAFGMLEKKRPLLSIVKLVTLTSAYLVVRFTAILMVVVRHPDPTSLDPATFGLIVDSYRDPLLQTLSFVPLAVLFNYWLPWKRDELALRSLADLRPARSLPVGSLAAVTGFALALGWLFQDPGVRKEGRVLIDEAHSPDWEQASATFDTETYGRDSVYNFAVFRDYLDSWFDVEVNVDGRYSEDLAQRCDVLVVKTPTIAFTEEEIAAIESFVREDGGGLLLIGDHTDLMGMTTRMNPIAERFGMRFRSDAANCLEDGGLLTVESTPFFPHPATVRLDRFPFMTSCTLDVPLDAENVIVSGNTFSDPTDYSRPSFFGNVVPDLADDFGIHVLSAARKCGKGRVLMIADATTFSNFGMHQRGCSEFVLGAVEYLNRSNRDVSPGAKRGLAVAVAAGAALLLAGVFMRRRALLWSTVVPLTLLIGGMAGVYTAREQILDAYPLPPRQTTPVTVAFVDRGCDAYFPPPLVEVPEPPEQSFDTFLVWTRRIGLEPRLTDLDGALGCDAIVLINPVEVCSARELRAIVDYVERGGRLLVMDSILNRKSTADSILHRFGLSTTLSFASHTNQYAVPPERESDATTFDEPDSGSPGGGGELIFEDVLARPIAARVPSPMLGVHGGTFVYTTEQDSVLATLQQHGSGRVLAMTDSVTFSRTVLGEQTDDPLDHQLDLYDAVYQLFRDYLFAEPHKTENSDSESIAETVEARELVDSRF